jgi:diguanylate cyclase (GGDEF)-like protein/PAS domain S-box-containing protein
MEEGYYELDLNGKITYCNPALAEILGYPVEELLGASHDLFVDGRCAKEVAERFSGVYRTGEPEQGMEIEVVRRDGGRRFISVSAQLILDQDRKALGLRGLHYDITARKSAELTLQRQALHDGLTGLPNRVLLHDRLSNAIAAAARESSHCALLLFDLNHFKEVNDTLGHAVGDQLIQQIGPRLASCLRDADTLARLGGDEFAVVLRGASQAEAERVADKILGMFNAPFDIAGVSAQVGSSVGVAIFPRHAQTAEDLLRCADVAMYSAKHGGTGQAVYSAENDPHSIERLSFVGELRHAFEYGKFSLEYQPKLRLSDFAPVGVEALARWLHPVRGWVSPSEFIPYLEKHGMIRPFTQWVIENAARQRAQWHAAGLAISVAVNISPSALRDVNFAGLVLAIVDRVGGTGNWLELEVTENALMDNPRLMLARLRVLRARGVRLSIDDFGTGYSSLAFLREFQADTLKIDRTFVASMTTEPRNEIIVQAMIYLAHALDLKVVAEGVESQAICDRLAALGCDEVQGFHLGRPMPAKELDAWWRKHSGKELLAPA